MEIADAADLIRPAVTHLGGVWADLGAGSGTFTFALASLLGKDGVVYAVDREGHGLTIGGRAGSTEADGVAAVVPVIADFRDPLPLADLDGVVMANSLHFVAEEEQLSVLAKIVTYLKVGGAFVLVEYDQRRGSPWVPFPVPFERFGQLAGEVGLGPVKETGRRRSRFGPKDIYAGAAMRVG